MFKKRSVRDVIQGPAHLLYHAAIVLLSAGLALSLPFTADFLAKKLLVYWALIGNERVFLVSVELALAMLLIFLFNYIGGSWKNRRYSRMAKEAGLVMVSPSRGFFARRKCRNLKESHGIARDIMIVGSTGFRTFADAGGDFHTVVRNCREARIMLLNPYSEGACIRAKSIGYLGITVEHLREQTRRSIRFLKELKALQKNVRLKLYNDVPFLKMAISGDYAWLKHYHAGFDIQVMAELVFGHSQNPGSLYVLFYQYFLRWWSDPSVPEYDLESDELVYRDSLGNEEKREPFEEYALVERIKD